MKLLGSSIISRWWSSDVGSLSILLFFLCVKNGEGDIYSFLQLQLGCNLSSASSSIYADRNSYEKRIVWGIAVTLLGLVTFAYVPLALCWLSTLIFGVPLAEQWVVPLGTDKA